MLLLSAPVSAAPLHPLAKENKIAGFRAMDQDGNGRVSLAEFLAARGDTWGNRQEFRWHDLNGDGAITLDEYMADPPRKPVPGKPTLRY
jgi:hypothetical protein